MLTQLNSTTNSADKQQGNNERFQDFIFDTKIIFAYLEGLRIF